jgi:1-aminocyclopropane-1-carboxylate deaminase/D-cysteine desulfhydrase-like pyridoxal-dependent ACC family enzyme
MHAFDLPQAPLQRLNLPWLQHAQVQVAILRLDLIDPLISGNKWFKLRHHLQQAATGNAPGLISLGGNHSNHLHALAAAGKRFGFATAGLLRGHAQDTPTVRDLQAMGMHLHWLGYGGYRARHQPGFWKPWQARYPGWQCIPEGGGGLAGAQGCALIVQQAQAQISALGWPDYDGWWLAAGTGTTVAGLAWPWPRRVRVPCMAPWRYLQTTVWRKGWQHWRAHMATSYTRPAEVGLPGSTTNCWPSSPTASSTRGCRWKRSTPARPCWPCAIMSPPGCWRPAAA